MLLERLDTVIAFTVILLGFSLIIMILCQMLSALLNLRGRNLMSGLETMLETLDPALAPMGRKIADKALCHPLISDSWTKKWLPMWRPASAVRLIELLDVLELLAGQERESDSAGNEREPWRGTLRDFLAKSGSRELIEKWFDGTMDRLSERFAMQMRLVTAIVSLLVAFVLQLDAFTIYDKLAQDPAVRASLVAGADTLLDKGDQLLGPESSAVPSAYREAVGNMKALAPAELLADEAASRRFPGQDIEALRSSLAGAVNGLSEPPQLASRADGETWLLSRLDGLSEAEGQQLVAVYHGQVEALLARAIDRLADEAVSIRQHLDSTKLELIPDPYPPLASLFEVWHLFGILVMTALLSLGAPFWFSLLKSLTSLRPILAGKAEKEHRERAGEDGQGAGSKPGSA